MNEANKELDAALTIAKRASMIVIALGLVELVRGIVVAPAGTLNFQVGGLLVGLLMLFGGLRILAVVRWLALLALAVLLCGQLVALILVPVDLILTQVRLYPAAFAASFIPWLVPMAIAAIAALRLSHPLLLTAWTRAGRRVHAARIPLVLGVVCAMGSAWFLYGMLDGEAGQKASRIAADRLGPGYKYFTNSVNKTTGKHTVISATVQAWNDHEVLLVPVKWQE
jgi:hypothetical protein